MNQARRVQAHNSGSNQEEDSRSRRLNDLNKRLKAIYEDEGIEYEDTTEKEMNQARRVQAHNSGSNQEEDSRTRRLNDLNKRLKAIYEDEGIEYEDTTDEDTIVDRTRVASQLRRKRIDQVFREIRRARNVELCFLVDITGSMQPHINEVRKKISEIVAHLTRPAGPQGAAVQEMKLAFVGYRDFGDSKQFEILPFCPSTSLFETFCQAIVASGGSDEPEDVFGGLENVLKLNWTAQAGTKVVFHICDAPCHGDEFHAPMGENYPKGDPRGRTHTDLFQQIKEKGIQYNFGKITEHTKIMLKKFSEAYGEPITVFDLKNVELLEESVISSVSSAILTSITSSMRTIGVARKERKYTLEPAEPNWDRLKSQKGKFTFYQFPDSIQDIIDDIPLDKSKAKSADVQIAPMPFAHGAERLAFYGRDVSTYCDASAKRVTDQNIKKKNEDIILKEYLHKGKGMNSAKRYELSNQLQTIATFLANKFKEEIERKTGQKKAIKFLKIRTLSLTETVRFMCAETRFAPTDKFIRFSNNTTYEITEKKAQALGVSSDFVQLVTAYSHWTYQVTGGYLMVVDLEGIVSEIRADGQPGVLLTDPAIHCKDLTRFGPMNHGRRGMDNFFQGHRCNDWCRRLGLPASNSE